MYVKHRRTFSLSPLTLFLYIIFKICKRNHLNSIYNNISNVLFSHNILYSNTKHCNKTAIIRIYIYRRNNKPEHYTYQYLYIDSNNLLKKTCLHHQTMCLQFTPSSTRDTPYSARDGGHSSGNNLAVRRENLCSHVLRGNADQIHVDNLSPTWFSDSHQVGIRSNRFHSC